MKALLGHLAVIAMGIYLPPLMIQDTGSAIFVLLILIPLICILTTFIYGIRHSFNILLPLGTGLLFIPAIFIYFNFTAWVYAPAYGVLALTGNLIGAMIHSRYKKAND